MKNIILIAALFAGSASLARAADAAENFDTNCVSCHGKDGKGATKAGRTAGVKDLSDPEYQKTFDDKKAFAQIKDGYKDDKGKEKMKSFGDKLSDTEITALVAYVRTLVPKK